MALYLLDGNVLTELEDRTKPRFRSVLDRLGSLKSADRVAISIVSAYEYRHGIADGLRSLAADDERISSER